jgi:hypothetical protein
MSTPKTPAEIAERLNDIREQLRVNELLMIPLRNEFRELQRSCPHDIVCSSCGLNTGDSCPDDDYCHMGANCKFCGERFDGWFCPDSPDYLCHYHSEKVRNGRYVVLNGNKTFRLPITDDARYETYDRCLFCEQPEERK